MAMNVSLQQIEKLLKGNQTVSQFGLSMMLTRLRGQYAKDSTPAAMQSYMNEVNAFLNKFQSIMGKDYETIVKL